MRRTGRLGYEHGGTAFLRGDDPQRHMQSSQPAFRRVRHARRIKKGNRKKTDTHDERQRGLKTAYPSGVRRIRRAVCHVLRRGPDYTATNLKGM